MFKLCKIILFTLMIVPQMLLSQSSIYGNIKDNEGNNIVFANVYLHNQKQFTSSLADGSFLINVGDNTFFNDTLIIRFIGYKTVQIPIYYVGNNIQLNDIILTPKINLLPEVEIVPPPPVEKIVKYAIKRAKKNYASEPTQLEGFYRETSYENDYCIMLNEAVVNVNYSGYRNKPNIKKRFKDYYNNQETNLKDVGNIFRYAQFFPFYTGKEDEVYIPFARKSYNLSKYRNNPTPYGGVNDLLAMDKVKFLYDFIDPKMLSKYEYKNYGKQKVNDIICYKIGYSPKISAKDKENKVWHPINSKMKHPIFAGFMYISVDDYSILSFEGQKYIFANFETYQKPFPYFAYPDYLTFNVSYKKNKKNRYVLENIEIEQIRTIKYNNEKIRYKSNRSLYLYEEDKQLSINKESKRFFYGNNTSLRNFISEYNEDFWNKYELSNHYKPLSPLSLYQLQTKSPLKNQFLYQNRTIDDLEKPHYKGILDIYNNQVDSGLYYIELKTKYDSLLTDFIVLENEYYDAVLEKIKNHKRYYSYHYFNALEDQESQDKKDFFILDNRKIYSIVDSNNHYIWYFKETNNKIIDWTTLSKNKQNFFVEKLELNQKQKIAVLYSEKGNIYGCLEVFDNGNDLAFFKNDKIVDFFWKSDSTIIYSKADLTERPFLVLETNLNSLITDTLFYLQNQEQELSLSKNQFRFLLEFGNKNETGIYELNPNSNLFELKVDLKLASNTNFKLSHFNSNHVALVESKDTSKLSFGKSINYKGLPIFYETVGTIEDIKSTKDFVVFTERHNGSFELKAINIKTKMIETINYLPKYSSVSIDKTSKANNDLTFSVENPLIPYYQLKLKLDSNKLDTIYSERATDLFKKTDFEYIYKEIIINDSVSVPVSILYKKVFKDSLKGFLIKTYGAYGSIDFPTYNVDHLIYANAGVGVAFIHPRGSGEKGLKWHLGGQKLNKWNTFSDYIACVEHLKNQFKLKKNQIVGYGSSAGGLVMGVAANVRPDLFGALIFDKPYLNIMEVMANEKLPLTTLEYSEFGDIKNKKIYEYIESYAPIENLKNNSYPNILIFNKYHDMNTPYWNTFKYLVKYREQAENKPLILMNTDFQAGHRGNVNRLIELDYQADMYAFIMHTINKSN